MNITLLFKFPDEEIHLGTYRVNEVHELMELAQHGVEAKEQTFLWYKHTLELKDKSFFLTIFFDTRENLRRLQAEDQQKDMSDLLAKLATEGGSTREQ